VWGRLTIKMELKEVGCRGIDWIELDQDRERCRALVTAVMNLRITYNEGNILTS
jgi:CRISPR/Cas system-associated protein Cas7 (RAMP superfamily)